MTTRIKQSSSGAGVVEFQSPPQKHKDSPEGKGAALGPAVFVSPFAQLFRADTRPFLFGFAMVAGAALFLLWPSDPSFLASFAMLAGLLFVHLVAVRTGRPAPLTLVSLLCVGIALGHSAGQVRTYHVAAPQVRAPIGPVMLEGWLKEVEPGQNGARLRIRVHALAGHPSEATPEFVRLTHPNRLEVFPGRFIRCWAVLRPPPAPEINGDYDFQRQAYFERLGAVGYVQGKCSGGALGAPASRLEQLGLQIDSARRRLAEFVNRAAGPRAGGFAAALVSGDRSYMPFEDQEALRNSGLAHLLAISGLHLGLVGGLAFFIGRYAFALIEPLALRVPVQKLAALLGIGSGALYLVISGASVSTQRAFIMLAVVLGAILFDRVALSLRSFAVALILVVLLQPETVLSPGFQMSFAATGALIATYEAWTRRRRRAEKPLKGVRLAMVSIVVTSTVAGLATAPFAFYHFSRVASLGLVANFVAMPVVSFISAPLAVFALIMTPFSLEDEALRAFGYSLELVLAIAHYFADSGSPGGPVVKAMPGLSLALLSLAMLGAVMGRGGGRFLLALPALAGAAYSWATSPPLIVHWSASGEVFVKAADDRWQRTELVEADGLPPLKFSGVGEADACAQGFPCILVTRGGTVLLTDTLSTCEAGAEHLLILARSARQPCPNLVTWQAVTASRAMSFTVKDGQIESTAPSPCGRRAWRSCP